MNWNPVVDPWHVIFFMYGLVATFGWVGNSAAAKSWRQSYKKLAGHHWKDD